MRNRSLSGSLALCACVMAAGCGATRPSKYYQLTVASDSSHASNAEPFPVTLLVGPITSSHLYREDRIVYSASGRSMGTYEYQRWAQPPTEMLEEVVLRELRASGRYRAVSTLRSNAQGDYLLRGRLYDFKEVSASPLVGRIALEFELRETKSGSTVWSHYYSREEPVKGKGKDKDASAVVAALDRGTQDIVSELREALEQYFSAHASGR